ncbi:MAG: flippase-like domain-containing protein [Negativicutes bacterium]|nr:flippase-like domain-containing protein [Negativicutes bacterium]
MAEKKPKDHQLNRRRIYRYLVPLLVLGLAVHILLPSLATLESSLQVLLSMPFWLVGLAILAEVSSYLGSGYLLKAIINLGKSNFTVFRGALITLASASLGLIGGWVTGMATTYYWVSKNEEPSDASKLTGFLPALLNNLILLLLAEISFLYLLLLHQITDFQKFLAILIFVVLAGGTVVLVFGFQVRGRIKQLVLRAIGFFLRLIKRPARLEGISNTLDELFNGMLLLQKKGWVKPVAGSCLMVGFDMLSLYFCFIAAGHPINPILLITGYSMALLLRNVAFFVPGGVGVVEGIMVKMYTSLGVAMEISVVATLSYRLISFWIPILLGFAANVSLGRVAAKQNQKK